MCFQKLRPKRDNLPNFETALLKANGKDTRTVIKHVERSKQSVDAKIYNLIDLVRDQSMEIKRLADKMESFDAKLQVKKIVTNC